MKYIFPFVLLLFLSACQQTSVPSNLPTMDTAGFATEEFDQGVSLVEKTNESGLVIEKGILVNGVKSGNWTTYHENGQVHVITPFANGLRNGTSVEFDNKGRLKKVSNYVNDEFHGEYKEFVSYIPIRESHFKNGKLHGLHKEYNEQGKLFRDMEFKDGVQDGEMHYYNPEGAITTTFYYKNGEKVDGGIVK